MDASYKQYDYTQGMDLAKAVPLDAQKLLDAAKQGATINEAEGWVQNLNQAAVQSQLQSYQTRLENHIKSTPTGDKSTIGDVNGKKIIPSFLPTMLAGTLPNQVVSKNDAIAKLPDSLQHQFTFKLYANRTDKATNNPFLNYTAKTHELTGKRLTLIYKPATDKDRETIESYLPKPNKDGSPIKPEQLPKSLPAYLINLIPQISLDGEVVATASSSVTMGTDLYSTGGFTRYSNISSWDLTSDESNVAGQATAIGISAQGISAAQMQRLKERLEQTKANLEAFQEAYKNDPNTPVPASIKGEQISGDILANNIWSWFQATESQSRLSTNQIGIIEIPGLSYGLFHAVANPLTSWGVVRNVKFPGVNIDIGHVRSLTWAKNNNRNDWNIFNRFSGQGMSQLEALVPEVFFNDERKCNIVGSPNQTAGLPDCNRGISAARALALAAEQGQKIYTITQKIHADNPNIVNTALSAHSSDVRYSVTQALQAGLEVSIHEKPITQDGWIGAGYTTIDPNTGAGGYLIEGGSNGGSLTVLSDSISNTTALILGATTKGNEEIPNRFIDLFLFYKSFVDRVLNIIEKCKSNYWIAPIFIVVLTFTFFVIATTILTYFRLAKFSPILAILFYLFSDAILDKTEKKCGIPPFEPRWF